ncbi:unnamed protein product [Amoebophrya sp. A120]|nr:unnamed protein product [Amoebophrya sp. A120]|eukprot:GSA120T00012974001.1
MGGAGGPYSQWNAKAGYGTNTKGKGGGKKGGGKSRINPQNSSGTSAGTDVQTEIRRFALGLHGPEHTLAPSLAALSWDDPVVYASTFGLALCVELSALGRRIFKQETSGAAEPLEIQLDSTNLPEVSAGLSKCLPGATVLRLRASCYLNRDTYARLWGKGAHPPKIGHVLDSDCFCRLQVWCGYEQVTALESFIIWSDVHAQQPLADPEDKPKRVRLDLLVKIPADAGELLRWYSGETWPFGTGHSSSHVLADVLETYEFSLYLELLRDSSAKPYVRARQACDQVQNSWPASNLARKYPVARDIAVATATGVDTGGLDIARTSTAVSAIPVPEKALALACGSAVDSIESKIAKSIEKIASLTTFKKQAEESLAKKQEALGADRLGGQESTESALARAAVRATLPEPVLASFVQATSVESCVVGPNTLVGFGKFKDYMMRSVCASTEGKSYIAWCKEQSSPGGPMERLLHYESVHSGRDTWENIASKIAEAKFHNSHKVWKTNFNRRFNETLQEVAGMTSDERARQLRLRAFVLEESAVKQADFALTKEMRREAFLQRARVTAQELRLAFSKMEEQQETVLQMSGLNDSQLEAVQAVLHHTGATICQGPPGTGKTRTIATMSAALVRATPTETEPAEITRLLRNFEQGLQSGSEDHLHGSQFFGTFSASATSSGSDHVEKELRRCTAHMRHTPRRVLCTAVANKAVFNMLEKIIQQEADLSPEDRCPGTIALQGVEDGVPAHLLPYFIHRRYRDVFQAPVGSVNLQTLRELVNDAPAFCKAWGVNLSNLNAVWNEFEAKSQIRKNERAAAQRWKKWAQIPPELTLEDFLRNAKNTADPGEAGSRADGAKNSRDQRRSIRARPLPLELEHELLAGASYIFSTLACCGRRSLSDALNDTSVLVSRLQKRHASEDSDSSVEQGSVDASFAQDLTIIVDEAAQATEADTFLALALQPSRLVLVGDPKQLSATVIHSNSLRKRGYARSMQERLQTLAAQPSRDPAGQAEHGSPRMHAPRVCFLDTQYRMHPEIAKFPCKQYYDGRLKDGTQAENEATGVAKVFLSSRLSPAHAQDLSVDARTLVEACAQNGQRYFVVCHSGEEGRQGGSAQNFHEADLVFRTFLALAGDKTAWQQTDHQSAATSAGATVSTSTSSHPRNPFAGGQRESSAAVSTEPDRKCVILSFYQGQRRLLDQMFAARTTTQPSGRTNFIKTNTSKQGSAAVHTVDSFQGSEAEVVLLSFVRSTSERTFLSDANRLNVALTRAKKFAIVFANVEKLLNESAESHGGDSTEDADSSAQQANQVRAILTDAKNRGLLVQEAVWEELLGNKGLQPLDNKNTAAVLDATCRNTDQQQSATRAPMAQFSGDKGASSSSWHGPSSWTWQTMHCNNYSNYHNHSNSGTAYFGAGTGCGPPTARVPTVATPLAAPGGWNLPAASSSSTSASSSSAVQYPAVGISNGKQVFFSSEDAGSWDWPWPDEDECQHDLLGVSDYVDGCDDKDVGHCNNHTSEEKQSDLAQSSKQRNNDLVNNYNRNRPASPSRPRRHDEGRDNARERRSRSRRRDSRNRQSRSRRRDSRNRRRDRSRSRSRNHRNRNGRRRGSWR